MPRGRRRKPAPQLPPKGFYQADVSVAEMVRDGTISLAEGWMLNLLAMFDWRGTGAADVTIRELARWLGVSREHAQRMFAHLRGLGLVDRGEDGRISVMYKSRDIETSLPTPLIGGGDYTTHNSEGISLTEKDYAPRAREENPPPPSFSNTPNLCDAEITQYPNHVISTSRNSGHTQIPPPLQGVFARLGVATPEGMEALASLGVGPRALTAWHRERQKSSGSNVGSMIRLAKENPDMARRQALRAARETGTWWGVDFCPRCGEEFQSDGHPPDVCPSCGVELRVCPECREVAMAGKPCPYCGAPDPELSDEEAEEDGDTVGGREDVSLAQLPGDEPLEPQTPLLIVQDVLRERLAKARGIEKGLYEQAVRSVEVLEFEDGYVLVVPSVTVRTFLDGHQGLQHRLKAFKGEDMLIEVVVRGSAKHRTFVEALKEG